MEFVEREAREFPARRNPEQVTLMSAGHADSDRSAAGLHEHVGDFKREVRESRDQHPIDRFDAFGPRRLTWGQRDVFPIGSQRLIDEIYILGAQGAIELLERA